MLDIVLRGITLSLESCLCPNLWCCCAWFSATLDLSSNAELSCSWQALLALAHSRLVCCSGVATSLSAGLVPKVCTFSHTTQRMRDTPANHIDTVLVKVAKRKEGSSSTAVK